MAIVFARFKKAVEFCTFVEDRGFRGIEVFGLAVVQYAATKANDSTAPISDNPAAKSISCLCVLARHPGNPLT